MKEIIEYQEKYKKHAIIFDEELPILPFITKKSEVVLCEIKSRGVVKLENASKDILNNRSFEFIDLRIFINNFDEE